MASDNHLVGLQLGYNLNYNYCQWNFFADSNFGMYNNHITSYQRMFAGDGTYATYAGSGNDMNERSTKNDVAFLGELRVGGAYDVTCNSRLVLAYRVIGISGVALSLNQIPGDFSNGAVVRQIDSDESIIIHGVQGGVEFKY